MCFPCFILPNITSTVDGKVAPRVHHLGRPVHGRRELGQLLFHVRPLGHVPGLIGAERFGRGAAEIAELDLSVCINQQILNLERQSMN